MKTQTKSLSVVVSNKKSLHNNIISQNSVRSGQICKKIRKIIAKWKECVQFFLHFPSKHFCPSFSTYRIRISSLYLNAWAGFCSAGIFSIVEIASIYLMSIKWNISLQRIHTTHRSIQLFIAIVIIQSRCYAFVWAHHVKNIIAWAFGVSTSSQHPEQT